MIRAYSNRFQLALVCALGKSKFCFTVRYAMSAPNSDPALVISRRDLFLRVWSGTSIWSLAMKRTRSGMIKKCTCHGRRSLWLSSLDQGYGLKGSFDHFRPSFVGTSSGMDGNSISKAPACVIQSNLTFGTVQDLGQIHVMLELTWSWTMKTILRALWRYFKSQVPPWDLANRNPYAHSKRNPQPEEERPIHAS